DQLMELLNGSITRNKLQNGLLRLIITRGRIEGIPWTHSGQPSVYILPRSLSPVPESPVKIVWVQESSYPLIRFKPAIKSVNYLGNMLAKKDAHALGAFEPIFVNPDGFITEGAIRNICFIRDNMVITPGVNLGVLPGVMRDTVIEVVKAMNLDFLEENIPLSDVNSMDEAFISSTGVGVLPCYWDGWRSDFSVTNIIKKKVENILGN
ncbi:MAG: aminotransferase class IV, partial [Candidatus Marinimicrobia bacterium]|nr:aminotransferase class IV [Candidatus Neomarinimicrobiota bacterium]